MRPAKTLRGLFWIAWCKPRGTGIVWFLCKSLLHRLAASRRAQECGADGRPPLSPRRAPDPSIVGAGHI